MGERVRVWLLRLFLGFLDCAAVRLTKVLWLCRDHGRLEGARVDAGGAGTASQATIAALRLSLPAPMRIGVRAVVACDRWRPAQVCYVVTVLFLSGGIKVLQVRAGSSTVGCAALAGHFQSRSDLAGGVVISNFDPGDDLSASVQRMACVPAGVGADEWCFAGSVLRKTVAFPSALEPLMFELRQAFPRPCQHTWVVNGLVIREMSFLACWLVNDGVVEFAPACWRGGWWWNNMMVVEPSAVDGLNCGELGRRKLAVTGCENTTGGV